MKKLLAAILSLCLVIAPMAIVGGAEDVVVDEYLEMEFDYMVYDYYYVATSKDGFFAEGEAPSAEAVDAYLSFYYEDMFAKYGVYDEATQSTVYTVPAEEYEACVGYFFSETEILVNTLRASSLYADGFYVVAADENLWLPEIDYNTYFYGYKDLGGGVFETYTIILPVDDFTYTGEIYVPDADDVEGVDYLYLPQIWVETDMDDVAMYSYSYKLGVVPVRISDAVKSLIKVDEYGMCTFLSYETANTAEVAADETLVSSDMVSTDEDNMMIASMLGAYAALPEEYFVHDSVLTLTNLMDGEAYSQAVLAVLDDLRAGGEIYVYEIGFEVGGEAVELTEQVEAFFAFTDTFEFEPTIYFINSDGEAVEVDSVTDYEWYVAKAQVSELGVFVIADADPEKDSEGEEMIPGGEGDIPGDVIVPDIDNDDEDEKTETETEPESETETEPETEEAKPSNPQTGDNSIALAIFAAVMFASCASIMVVRFRKKEN